MNNFNESLGGLNPQQYECVIHDSGPMLILAGAGSGKTRVVITRIKYLISKHNVSPKNILALTFTNKAAKEMKERVQRGNDGIKKRGLLVTTFHSFGVKVLKKNIDFLGYRSKFTIFNSSDKIHLLTNIMTDLKIDLEVLTPETVSYQISEAKNKMIHSEDSDNFFQDGTIYQIYGFYQRTLKGFNILDFDDLLFLTVDLFEKFPDIAMMYSKQFKYIMVDEYQDTNNAQYMILSKLLTAHNNITVVGDDDQSIYGWRGADIKNILNFENDFPGTKVIKLEQNYRSTNVILKVANSLISKNKDRKGKKLWTNVTSNELVKVLSCSDEEDEAQSVLQIINNLKNNKAASNDDIAIVFRTNFQTRPFEELFASQGINYTVVGGQKFFDKKEVKDIIAYLRLMANRHDEIALLRVINKPRRGIGPKTIEKIISYATDNNLPLYSAIENIDLVEGVDPKISYQISLFYEIIEENSKKLFKQGSMVPVVRAFIDEIRYDDELLKDARDDMKKYERSRKFIQGIINSIAMYEQDEDVEKPDLFGYLHRISLLTKDDKEQDNDSSITLLTMHSCKGLEFPYVFITGVEEGTIPHARSLEDNGGQIEEERRLLYVALTRAMKELYLSFTEGRHKYGEFEPKTPSRFLEEMDPDYLDFIDSEELLQIDDEEIVATLGKFLENNS